MTKKQSIIIVCFNIIALYGIFANGIKLGRDIQAISHDIFNLGINSGASGRISLFSYTFDIGGTLVTIYNYLLIFSLITIVINIGLITSFTVLNRRTK